MNNYYQDNLSYLSDIFYRAPRSWIKFSAFKEFNYCIDDHLFNELQRFAISGNIISLIGDINNLLFVCHPISIVDTSNICDYEEIKIKMHTQPFNTKVIKTKLFVPISETSCACKTDYSLIEPSCINFQS